MGSPTQIEVVTGEALETIKGLQVRVTLLALEVVRLRDANDALTETLQAMQKKPETPEVPSTQSTPVVPITE